MKRTVHREFVEGRPLTYVVEVDVDGGGHPIGDTARLCHGVHGVELISDDDLLALARAYGLPST